MNKLVLVTVVALLATSAQAQPYGSCEPERVIGAMMNAVMRVAPMFTRPRETTGAAVAAPPPSLTREEWKRSLIDQGRAFCARYPDDGVCEGQRR